MVLLPLGIVGAYLLLKAAGSVLLLFIIAGLIALFLNPLVTLLLVPHPARCVGGDRDGRPGRVPGRRSGSSSPHRSPTRPRASRTTSRATSTTPTTRSPTSRTGSTGAAGTSRSSARARPRCRRSASASPAAPARSSASPATPCSARRGQHRADPDHRPEHLHAIYGDRIGALVRARCAARRRDAGGRLPDARPGLAVRLRPRPGPVQPDHGHERGPDAVGARLARDLPRGQDVRGRVRRLVRLRGADPVHRARRSAASRRWSSPRSATTRSTPSG